jgi:hypothetical protein
MRVWGKVGITWPCIAAGGRDGAEARVALATDLSGRPFATRCLVVKICHGCAGHGVEATGTRVGNASVGGRKLGGITSGSSG